MTDEDALTDPPSVYVEVAPFVFAGVCEPEAEPLPVEKDRSVTAPGAKLIVTTFELTLLLAPAGRALCIVVLIYDAAVFTLSVLLNVVDPTLKGPLIEKVAPPFAL